MRIITILGTIYSGSTMLSGLLATLPGVAALGEVHGWLINNLECLLCGPSCRIFSKLNRDDIKPGEFYAKLGEALTVEGYGTLVTSDKQPPIVQGHIGPGRAEAIVLFKRPEAHVASMLRHKQSFDGIDVLPVLAGRYKGILELVDSGYFKRAHFVSLERLAGNPYGEFLMLCKRMRLPGPAGPGVQLASGTWHNIGGNSRTWSRETHGRGPIYLDDRWRTDLKAENIKAIQGYEPLLDVYHRLLERA